MIRWASDSFSHRVLVDPVFENSQLLQRSQPEIKRLPCLQMSRMPHITSVDRIVGGRKKSHSPCRVGSLPGKRRPPPSLSATNLEAVLQNRVERSKSLKGPLGASESQFQLFAPSQATPIPFASRKKLYAPNDVRNATFIASNSRVHSATGTQKVPPDKPLSDGRLSRGHAGQYFGEGLDQPKTQEPPVGRQARRASAAVHVIEFNSVCQPAGLVGFAQRKRKTWHGNNGLSLPVGAYQSTSIRRDSLPSTGSSAPISKKEDPWKRRQTSPGLILGHKLNFDNTVAEMRQRGSVIGGKNQEWLISEIETLQQAGIPKGIDALRAVLANKCGSLALAFAKMDYNGNGELSLLEFAGGLAVLFPPMAGQNAIELLTGMNERQVFKMLDTNSNGTICLAEFAGEDVEPANLPGWHAVKKRIDFGSKRRTSTAERQAWAFRRNSDEVDGSKPGRRSVRKDLVIDVDDEVPRGDLKDRVSSRSPSPSPKGGAFHSAFQTARSMSGFDSPKLGPFVTSPSAADSGTAGCDVFVLVAKWTSLLARQRRKKMSSLLNSPERSPTHFPNFRRALSNQAEVLADEDSQDEEHITSAVDEAEQMMNKVFKESCGGYRKHNTHLMTRPKFFEFLSEIGDSIPERKMHSLYDSQMELQQDLTMATYGFAISEGLNYDSFRVCLHRAAVSMKLNLHHVLGDLISDYEKRATSQVAFWKRQCKARSPMHKSKSKVFRR